MEQHVLIMFKINAKCTDEEIGAEVVEGFYVGLLVYFWFMQVLS